MAVRRAFADRRRDIRMPRLDGLAATRRITSDPDLDEVAFRPCGAHQVTAELSAQIRATERSPRRVTAESGSRFQRVR